MIWSEGGLRALPPAPAWLGDDADDEASAAAKAAAGGVTRRGTRGGGTRLLRRQQKAYDDHIERLRDALGGGVQLAGRGVGDVWPRSQPGDGHLEVAAEEVVGDVWARVGWDELARVGGGQFAPARRQSACASRPPRSSSSVSSSL